MILTFCGLKVRQTARGEHVFFFLRDPITRFISGFYSRKRKGWPRYTFEWNSFEKIVYETFETPNQLACSLADKSSKNHFLAQRALNGVIHLKHYENWCGIETYFRSRVDDIIYIGFQETLDEDFNKLARVLELPQSACLPTDDIGCHKSPEGLDKWIDPKGIKALNNWYSKDYKLISLCKEIMLEK